MSRRPSTARRLARTFLVNFYKDAVQNLVGRIFAQPLVFAEDTPQEILDFWENVDDQGTVGDIFIAARRCRCPWPGDIRSARGLSRLW